VLCPLWTCLDICDCHCFIANEFEILPLHVLGEGALSVNCNVFSSCSHDRQHKEFVICLGIQTFFIMQFSFTVYIYTLYVLMAFNG
jgi:hypothetical protein